MSCRDGEGWKVVSRSRDFDLTPCAEEGIVASALLGVLLVAALLRSLQLVAFETKRDAISKKSWLVLYAKLALLASAFVTSVVNVVLIVTRGTPVAVPKLYVIEPIGLLAALCLTLLNHTRTRRSSTVLLLFWPLYTLSFAIWIRTVVEKHAVGANRLVLPLKAVVVFLGLLSFALEMLGPESDKDTKREVSVEGTEKKEVHVEHPTETANVFSIWTFSWMTGLMRKGANQYITEDDLPSLPTADESVNLGKKLEASLKKRPLWRALFASYGGPYATAAALKVLADMLNFLQPQLLRWLLSYIATYQSARYIGLLNLSSKDQERLGPWNVPGLWYTSQAPAPSPVEGFAIAGIMFAASIAQTVLIHQYFQRAFETGMRVRAGLVTVIYNKALVLSNDEQHTRSTGGIVNYMSVDATRLQDFCSYGLMGISGPFQIFLAFLSLYNLLGWSAFVGVAIMVLSIPLNTVMARILKRLQEEQMKNRDERTRLMNELLNNIKSIKLYAWEFAFLRRILDVRNNRELKQLRKIGLYSSFNTTLFSGIPLLVAFSSFATAAAVSDKPLTSDVIFPAISLFMLLQFPLAMIPQVTSNLIEAIVSLKRLRSFLGAAELQPDARAVVTKSEINTGDTVLDIRNADFSWSKDAVEPTLEDISLSVKKGELVGILGRVGEGKTSLLSAIIGEMTRREGEVVLSGTVSYAPQNAWIQSATVRENILFGHVYDEVFYGMVVAACALEPDLALLPEGDLTEVGEKGITLSGGQRARISLARAVYARADLVLLDDCLAAVDSHVAKHVFDHVIGPNGLLATKARILVTNSISFLRQFDQIAYLRRGIIIETGSFNSLMAQEDGHLHRLVLGHGINGSTSTSGASTPFIKSGPGTPPESELISAEETEKHAVSLSEKLNRRTGSFAKAKLADPPPTRAPASTGLSKEHSEQGRVKIEVYKKYIKASSTIAFAAFIVAVLGYQAASVCANFVLRAWGNHNKESGANDGMWYYLALYGICSLTSVVLGGASAVFMWVICGLKSAKHLHNSMLDALLKAPLSYFELTPTGRILNLFSRDTYVIDQILARVIQNTVRTTSITLGIIVVIGISFPPFLVAVIPLGWFYLRVMKYYLATSRELKRLDAVSRSPIFAWFSESLAGLSTIRAFSQQPLFVAANQRRIDRNQICYLPSISVNRWLAVRLEFVGSSIILVVALLSVTALVTTGVDAGLVGLVLSYALNTTGSLNWLVRSASEVEQNIVSVERILHQTDVTPEAPREIPDAKPSEEWPSMGEIEFRHYSTRYRPELDLVLKDINVTITPKEKIGLIGRTGSGKSTFLLSLFRIIEPAEGTILIDGVDISKLGLHDLRSQICIVPQSPDLFEGTLRENIDPVGAYPDPDIWIALGQAHLKEYVESLPEKLDAPVREGGSSLSSGQRQLLCFARALLRKTKILVLDEATSAVDLDTDRAIQEVIRGEAFKEVTILTIAHRLNTIMDSDRVLVMDAGKVAELDTPEKLLADDRSMFYSLAASAGLAGPGSKEEDKTS